MAPAGIFFAGLQPILGGDQVLTNLDIALPLAEIRISNGITSLAFKAGWSRLGEQVCGDAYNFDIGKRPAAIIGAVN